MITAKQAAELVLKKYPKTNPRRVVDLDNNRYVVEAPVLKNEVDLAVPFYYVTKDGEDVGVFNPLKDLDKFIEAGKTAILIK